MAESNRKPHQQYRANGGGRGGGVRYHNHNNNHNYYNNNNDNNHNRSYNHGNRTYYGNHGNHGQGSYDSRFNDHEEDLNRLSDEGLACEKLYMELTEKLNHRLRHCADLEAEIRQRHNAVKADVKELAEERKRVAAWRAEVIAKNEQAERILEEARKEREQIERRSTDIAVERLELDRAKRDFENRRHDDVPQAPGLIVNQPQAAREVAAEADVDEVPLAKRVKLTRPEPVPETNEKRERVHAALKEDAPGLFELLDEKGLLEDMEIINSAWSEDSSSPSEDFKDLTNLINKHWGPSSHLTKDGRSKVQTTSSSKPNYCLPCLISLVEHTRVLKQRKLPVKWGWCRALNAFLFVFEKHNRIVIERPEYGYATYFFELVHSLPVKWQVDRLIKVMSCVCNCRAALIDNRPLKVQDLLPEEATVLEDYGWDSNVGVGSLLNFCDRVHHDYKTEDEAGEWKAKIGKLLLDGHDNGGIVVKLPRKLRKDGELSLSSCEEGRASQVCTVKQEAQEEVHEQQQPGQEPPSKHNHLIVKVTVKREQF